MKIKIKTFGLLMLCLGLVFFKGRRAKKTNSVKRIVIVQNAKLGDMVCTTPMFAAVKEKYPNCEVIVVGNKINAELLKNHPFVDQYIEWQGDASGVGQKIKAVRADYACTTGPDFNSLASLILAGVPCISAPRIEGGYSPYETRSYKILRRWVISIPHRMEHYAPREYLRLLEPVGIFSANTRKLLKYSQDAEEAVEIFFSENGIDFSSKVVGVSVTAGNKVKIWPKQRFAEVINYLIERYGAKVIVTGSSSEKEMVREVISRIYDPDSVVDASGSFSMDEFKCAISKLDLFISVDTGPVYIAEAFGVPTIDIVGPMDDREQPPKGERHLIVSARKEGEKPVLHIMNARVYDEEKAMDQIERIPASQVCAEVDKLLSY